MFGVTGVDPADAILVGERIILNLTSLVNCLAFVHLKTARQWCCCSLVHKNGKLINRFRNDKQGCFVTALCQTTIISGCILPDCAGPFNMNLSAGNFHDKRNKVTAPIIKARIVFVLLITVDNMQTTNEAVVRIQQFHHWNFNNNLTPVWIWTWFYKCLIMCECKWYLSITIRSSTSYGFSLHLKLGFLVIQKVNIYHVTLLSLLVMM